MGDLEFDDPVTNNEAASERDSRKSHQREEHGKKRRQVVEGLVGIGWNNILLREHLHHIGHAMEHSEHPKTEDVRTIRPNAVLNEGGLLALHPCVKSCEVERSEMDDFSQHDLVDYHFYHFLGCSALL